MTADPRENQPAGRPASPVFLAELPTDRKTGVLDKITRLLVRLGLEKADLQRQLVAVKIHFGEKGNDAYVRPVYVARIVSFLKGRGAKPFLTDTNTLYVGSRGESVSHHLTAVANGFGPESVGAPVIIAGGLRGTEARGVPINGRHFEEVLIAPEIVDADIILGVTHFKGHEMSGFGGTIKNFGMGAASRRGKLAMHSRVKPTIGTADCTGCRLCFRWCAQRAIVCEGGKAAIDASLCVGCGACLPTCPAEAIRIVWDEQAADMQEKMAEYAWGALKAHLGGRAFFLNFVMNVSPLCDCYPFADAPVVPDAGILASADPVAIDQASADLVNAQPGLASSSLPREALAAGADKFRAIHPRVDWSIHLRHAEELGLGFRRYRLTTV